MGGAVLVDLPPPPMPRGQVFSVETAVNIAYSCRLFSTDMEVITLNARSQETTEETIRFYLEQIGRCLTRRPSDIDGGDGRTRSSSFSMLLAQLGNFLFGRRGRSEVEDEGAEGDEMRPRFGASLRQRRKRALVVDGRTLSYVLERTVDKLFLKLAQQCGVVLCCRATPLQKASVVKLVKDRLNVLTLAIGDGANDVSMIQAADIGVGISGQEGMQAVMASDFALARFRYLERLLLVHGHWCYDRLARAVVYFFYKNAAFIFILFWYQLYCGFTGAVMIDQLYLMLYNVLFTSLPPLILGIYDQDCPAHLLLKRPALYAPGRRSKTYTKYSFWVNMLDALYQSIIIYFVPFLVYYDSDVDIWEFGTTICTACFFVQMLHVAIECKSWGKRCLVLDPNKAEVRLKLHWVPCDVPDDAIRKALEPYGRVEGIAREAWHEDGFQGVESTTRAVRLTLKEGVTLEKVPHQLRLVHGTALVIAPGRAPMCLRCRKTGHVRRQCKVPRCELCRRFGHEKEDCIKTYATVTDNGATDELTEHLMDEEEAEVAAGGTAPVSVINNPSPCTASSGSSLPPGSYVSCSGRASHLTVYRIKCASAAGRLSWLCLGGPRSASDAAEEGIFVATVRLPGRGTAEDLNELLMDQEEAEKAATSSVSITEEPG
ncbi:phospholipid-transporting ATPase VB [Ixodes scapularis]